MSDSPFSDLGRPPLRQAALNRALVHEGSLWRDIRVVPETGSTNGDLAELAREHPETPEGTVLVAEAQTSGRGRLGRTWSAPPRSGLMFSMLLRPGVTAAPGGEAVPVPRQGWLPLLTGVAVASAIRAITARAGAGDFEVAPDAGRPVLPTLKWPNDLLVGERKLAGILAERVDDAVIVGVGLNVGLRADELPVPTATSLEIEGAALTDRGILLRAILREFEAWYGAWRRVHGDPDADLDHIEPEGGGLRGAYRRLCATIGREVRVELPGYITVGGTARDVDASGRLILDTAGGPRTLSAGDVVHVRPEPGDAGKPDRPV